MSFIRNLFKTAGRYAGCTVQPAANLSRKNDTHRRQEAISRSNPPRYNLTPADDGCRYVVKDKTTLVEDYGFAEALPKVRKRITENRYISQKTNMEKKKCFQYIEDMQKRYEMRKKKTVVPQTFYDSEEPNLWMKVKFMYTPGNFSHTYSHVDQ